MRLKPAPELPRRRLRSLRLENDRLADEVARLRALFTPDAAQARTEIKQQMKDLKAALLALLDQSSGSGLH